MSEEKFSMFGLPTHPNDLSAQLLSGKGVRLDAFANGCTLRMNSRTQMFAGHDDKKSMFKYTTFEDDVKKNEYTAVPIQAYLIGIKQKDHPMNYLTEADFPGQWEFEMTGILACAELYETSTAAKRDLSRAIKKQVALFPYDKTQPHRSWVQFEDAYQSSYYPVGTEAVFAPLEDIKFIEIGIYPIMLGPNVNTP